MKKQGKIVLEKFDSKILKGNPPGDPTEREFPVYLPPSYGKTGKKFPVVYLISGYTGKGIMQLNVSFLSENIQQRLDRLIANKKIKEMIVVMPDCITKYGGSQFINSEATGNYEDYLTTELVPYIDKKYSSINKNTSRAVCGKSSGGYGAAVLAMKNPGIFGLMCSTAGDMYFEYCYLPDFPKFIMDIEHYGKGHKAVANFITNEFNYNQPKPKFFHNIINIIGMASCYSPNPNGIKKHGYNFDLPFDISTGELRTDVFDRWLKHDPVRMAYNYVSNLKKLKLIYLDAGLKDEFNLQIGARIFCEKLKEKKIKYIHEEFDDGHMNIQYRYDRTFEVISEVIDDV
ncbi:MAG: alpha/beta hydrolase-fold protein [Bacteroidota bacterium]|nr:alpha/beta hydrolase-fold protein [Bacteroidota bacterium]